VPSPLQGAAAAAASARRAVRALMSQLVARVASQLEGMKASCDADTALVRQEAAAALATARDAAATAAAAHGEAALLRPRCAAAEGSSGRAGIIARRARAGTAELMARCEAQAAELAATRAALRLLQQEAVEQRRATAELRLAVGALRA